MTTIIRGSLTAFLLLLVSACAEVYGNCNKRHIQEFADCIELKFPIGSSYIELEQYLKQQEFKQANSLEDDQNNRFYYSWSPNGLNLANYGIVVTGQYSDDLKIIELEVPASDNYCNKWNKPQFSECIKRKFPLGSTYADLDNYLKQKGFKLLKYPDYQSPQFYYVWLPNIDDRNFKKIIVISQYNDDLKIVKLEVR